MLCLWIKFFFLLIHTICCNSAPLHTKMALVHLPMLSKPSMIQIHFPVPPLSLCCRMSWIFLLFNSPPLSLSFPVLTFCTCQPLVSKVYFSLLQSSPPSDPWAAPLSPPTRTSWSDATLATDGWLSWVGVVWARLGRGDAKNGKTLCQWTHWPRTIRVWATTVQSDTCLCCRWCNCNPNPINWTFEGRVFPFY